MIETDNKLKTSISQTEADRLVDSFENLRQIIDAWNNSQEVDTSFINEISNTMPKDWSDKHGWYKDDGIYFHGKLITARPPDDNDDGAYLCDDLTVEDDDIG